MMHFRSENTVFKFPWLSLHGKHLSRFQKENTIFNFFSPRRSEDGALKFHVISRVTDFCFIMKVLCGAHTSWNQKQVSFSSPFCSTPWEGTNTLLQTFRTCKIFVDISICIGCWETPSFFVLL